jgi:hypothetical protein
MRPSSKRLRAFTSASTKAARSPEPGGPQPLDELERLGRQQAELFAAGERVPQMLPPPLPAMASALTFTHQPPQRCRARLELLIAYLEDSRPGTWLGALRERGWLQRFTAERLYAFAGQLLWHLDLKLSADACPDEASALLHGWFRFIRQADREQLNHQFGLLQHSRRTAPARSSWPAGTAQASRSPGWMPKGCRRLAPCWKACQVATMAIGSLPVDPLLKADLPHAKAQPLPAALKISDQLPPARQYAALYLRWHVPSPLRQQLQRVLERPWHHCRNAVTAPPCNCSTAAPENTGSCAAPACQQQCCGQVEQALALMLKPPASCWLPCMAQPRP